MSKRAIRQFKLLSVGCGLLAALSLAVVARADAEMAVQVDTDVAATAGEATLVVYRTDESARTGNLSFQIRAGESKLGRLKSDRAMVVTVPAGEHSLTTSMEHTEPLPVTLRAGETIYVAVEPRVRGALIRVSLAQVDERIAFFQQPKIELSI